MEFGFPGVNQRVLWYNSAYCRRRQKFASNSDIEFRNAKLHAKIETRELDGNLQRTKPIVATCENTRQSHKCIFGMALFLLFPYYLFKIFNKIDPDACAICACYLLDCVFFPSAQPFFFRFSGQEISSFLFCISIRINSEKMAISKWV